MPNQQLLDYIKQKTEQGGNSEDIKKELIAAGWAEVDINEALHGRTQADKNKPIIAFFIGIALVSIGFFLLNGEGFKTIRVKEYDTKGISNIWGSSVVRIICDEDSGQVSGSGTLWHINSKFVVTTNKHVADSQKCVIEVTPFENGISNSKNTLTYKAKEDSFRTIEGDYDFLSFSLEEYESKSPISKLSSYAHAAERRCDRIFYPTGERVAILGYPSIGSSGGEDLTVTEGIISGVEEGFSFSDTKQFTWYVTSAKIEQGNSGGAAIASDGCFIGIPTWSTRGTLESQGRIFIYGGENSFINNNLQALILWTQEI